MEFGGVNLDEALRVLLFQHRTAAALARLAADPEITVDYLDEARGIAEADVALRD